MEMGVHIDISVKITEWKSRPDTCPMENPVGGLPDRGKSFVGLARIPGRR
jgi:hypothetical protein